MAHGGSQARDLIGFAAASLSQSHSTTGSELRLQPTPQLMAMLDPQGCSPKKTKKIVIFFCVILKNAEQRVPLVAQRVKNLT